MASVKRKLVVLNISCSLAGAGTVAAHHTKVDAIFLLGVVLWAIGVLTGTLIVLRYPPPRSG